METSLSTSNIREFQAKLNSASVTLTTMEMSDLLMAFRVTLNLLERIGEMMTSQGHRKPMDSLRSPSLGERTSALNRGLPPNSKSDLPSFLQRFGNQGQSRNSSTPIISSVSYNHHASSNHHTNHTTTSNSFSQGGRSLPQLQPAQPNMESELGHRSHKMAQRPIPTTNTAASIRSQMTNSSSSNFMVQLAAGGAFQGGNRGPNVGVSGDASLSSPSQPDSSKGDAAQPIELSDEEDQARFHAKIPRLKLRNQTGIRREGSAPGQPIDLSNGGTVPLRHSLPGPGGMDEDEEDCEDMEAGVGTQQQGSRSSSPARVGSMMSRLHDLMLQAECWSSGRLVYVCPLCRKPYTIKASIRYHLKVVHFRMHLREKEVLCQRCHRRFTSVSAVNRHSQRCHMIYPVVGPSQAGNEDAVDVKQSPGHEGEEEFSPEEADALCPAVCVSVGGLEEGAAMSEGEKEPEEGGEEETNGHDEQEET